MSIIRHTINNISDDLYYTNDISCNVILSKIYKKYINEMFDRLFDDEFDIDQYCMLEYGISFENVCNMTNSQTLKTFSINKPAIINQIEQEYRHLDFDVMERKKERFIEKINDTKYQPIEHLVCIFNDVSDNETLEIIKENNIC